MLSGGNRVDVDVSRTPTTLTMRIVPALGDHPNGSGMPALLLAPAFPLDAVIDRVLIDGKTTRPRLMRVGDVQFAEVDVAPSAREVVAEFRYRGGTDVYEPTPTPYPGSRNQGIRIVRSRADDGALRLLLEGRAGRTYDLFLRTPRRPGSMRGATLVRDQGSDPVIRVTFAGDGDGYTRQEVVLELR